MAKKKPPAVTDELVSAVMKSLGKKGGTARAKSHSAKELSDAGRKAVQARWAKYRAEKAKKKT